MRINLLFISILLFSNLFGQKPINSKLKKVEGNSFFEITNDSNKQLIVFLHGGVNNPYFEQNADQIELDYLIENNQDFLKQAQRNGFDLLLPITNDSLNWLENPSSSFLILKKIIASSAKEYENISIGGFSDGGTGSFKIFYNNPAYFDGLLVFNGYPQHQNFYKTVDYTSINNKKVLFFSTDKDKVIPYEFLLTEYCSQKETNPNTFFYLSTGDHSFTSYTEEDIKEVFDILTGRNENCETEAIQGFMKKDELVSFYTFRKKVLRQYSIGKEVYTRNREQEKNYSKK